MGQVRVGTASWTDRTLIESGWYPPETGTPEKRLRYYARQFPLVEVDSTYYALPSRRMAQMWAARTPGGLAVTTSALAVVRLHGHSSEWESKDIYERFGYRYTDRELTGWADRITSLARAASDTHVLFNNCYSDYAQVNARQLATLLNF